MPISRCAQFMNKSSMQAAAGQWCFLVTLWYWNVVNLFKYKVVIISIRLPLHTRDRWQALRIENLLNSLINYRYVYSLEIGNIYKTKFFISNLRHLRQSIPLFITAAQSTVQEFIPFQFFAFYTNRLLHYSCSKKEAKQRANNKNCAEQKRSINGNGGGGFLLLRLPCWINPNQTCRCCCCCCCGCCYCYYTVVLHTLLCTGHVEVLGEGTRYALCIFIDGAGGKRPRHTTDQPASQLTNVFYCCCFGFGVRLCIRLLNIVCLSELK